MRPETTFETILLTLAGLALLCLMAVTALRILWRARWVIIGSTVAVVILGWLAGAWVLG